MPSDWTTTKKVDRKFFWKVLCTLAPLFVEELVLNCRKQREANKLKKKVAVPRPINLHPDWTNELLKLEFMPCKYIDFLLYLFLSAQPKPN